MVFRRRDRPVEDDPAAAIRAAILAITTARETAGRNAAAALVNQAHVGRALALQRAELARSISDVDTAVAAAERVARDARSTDGPAGAATYEQHVAGLQAQRAVLTRAVEQIDGLSGASGEHQARARELLVNSRRELDAALHEQLRLLVAVERLDRARTIAAARTQRDRPTS